MPFSFFRKKQSPGTGVGKRPGRGFKYSPRLEALEERIAPAGGVFVENFTDDLNPALAGFDTDADGVRIRIWDEVVRGDWRIEPTPALGGTGVSSPHSLTASGSPGVRTYFTLPNPFNRSVPGAETLGPDERVTSVTASIAVTFAGPADGFVLWVTALGYDYSVARPFEVSNNSLPVGEWFKVTITEDMLEDFGTADFDGIYGLNISGGYPGFSGQFTVYVDDVTIEVASPPTQPGPSEPFGGLFAEDFSDDQWRSYAESIYQARPGFDQWDDDEATVSPDRVRILHQGAGFQLGVRSNVWDRDEPEPPRAPNRLRLNTGGHVSFSLPPPDSAGGIHSSTDVVAVSLLVHGQGTVTVRGKNGTVVESFNVVNPPLGVTPYQPIVISNSRQIAADRELGGILSVTVHNTGSGNVLIADVGFMVGFIAQNTPPVAADFVISIDPRTGFTKTFFPADAGQDPDFDEFRVYENTQPRHGTLTRTGGEFRYITDPGNFFVPDFQDKFTYTLRDERGGISERATVTLVFNRPPAGRADAYTLWPGSLDLDIPAEKGLLANDYDSDGDTLVIHSHLHEEPEAGYEVNQPGHPLHGLVFLSDQVQALAGDNSWQIRDHDGTFFTFQGNLRRVRALNVVLAEDGAFTVVRLDGKPFPGGSTFTFSYRLWDGINDPVIVPVTIRVEIPDNPALVASGGTVSCDHGEPAPLVLSFGFHDAAPDGTVEVVMVNQPRSGTVTGQIVDDQVVFTYRPRHQATGADLAQLIGSDSFSYRLVNGTGKSNVALVNVEVPNRAPEAMLTSGEYQIGGTAIKTDANPAVLDGALFRFLRDFGGATLARAQTSNELGVVAVDSDGDLLAPMLARPPQFGTVTFHPVLDEHEIIVGWDFRWTARPVSRLTEESLNRLAQEVLATPGLRREAPFQSALSSLAVLTRANVVYASADNLLAAARSLLGTSALNNAEIEFLLSKLAPSAAPQVPVIGKDTFHYLLSDGHSTSDAVRVEIHFTLAAGVARSDLFWVQHDSISEADVTNWAVRITKAILFNDFVVTDPAGRYADAWTFKWGIGAAVVQNGPDYGATRLDSVRFPGQVGPIHFDTYDVWAVENFFSNNGHLLPRYEVMYQYRSPGGFSNWAPIVVVQFKGNDHSDSDGVPDAAERAVPAANMDGNGDGIPDWQQNHVTSLPSAHGGWMTLETGTAGNEPGIPGSYLATSFFDVSISPNQGGVAFESPLGLLNFQVAGLAPYEKHKVAIRLHQPVFLNRLFQLLGDLRNRSNDAEFFYNADGLVDRVILHLQAGHTGLINFRGYLGSIGTAHATRVLPDRTGLDFEVQGKAPNEGDGNNDGVKDNLQAHVASLPGVDGTPAAGAYLTLVSPAGTSLVDVRLSPRRIDGVPSLATPFGELSFRIEDIAPGSLVPVEIIIHGGFLPSQFVKYDPARGFFNFNYDPDTGEGAQWDGGQVILWLRDGGVGDADGQANGVIVDPLFLVDGAEVPGHLPLPVGIPSSYSWTVDMVAPETGLTATPPAYSASAGASFSFSGDGTGTAVAGYEYRLDGGAWISTTQTHVSYSDLTDGIHTFEVRALDQAGNVDASPASYRWTVDLTAPAVTLSGPSRAFANGSAVVQYTVTYDDAHFSHSTLTTAAITLHRTGTADATESSVAGAGRVWTVTLSGFTGDGTLALSLAAGTAADLAGSAAEAAGPSAPVSVDTTAASVTLSGPSVPVTRGGPVTYTVTYADPHLDRITLDESHVTLLTTGTASGVVRVSGTGKTRTITIDGITGDGSLTIQLAAGTAVDQAGNPAPAARPGLAFDVDNTGPAATLSGPSSPIAVYRPVYFYVRYADRHFQAATLKLTDLVLHRTGTAKAQLSLVKLSPTLYRVTLHRFTGQGSLRLSVRAGTAVDAVGNRALAAGPSQVLQVRGRRVLRVSQRPVSPLLRRGQTAVFTMDYANLGNQEAQGVVLRQVLPAYARFNKAASTAGWVHRGGGVYSLNLGTLAPGRRGAVRFGVTFASNAPVGARMISRLAITDALAQGVHLASGVARFLIVHPTGRLRYR